MVKLKHREVKSLAHGHQARKGQCLECEPSVHSFSLHFDASSFPEYEGKAPSPWGRWIHPLFYRVVHLWEWQVKRGCCRPHHGVTWPPPRQPHSRALTTHEKKKTLLIKAIVRVSVRSSQKLFQLMQGKSYKCYDEVIIRKEQECPQRWGLEVPFLPHLKL